MTNGTLAVTNVAASVDDFLLIEQLRSGNEEAFAFLIDSYHQALLRLAKVYVTAQSVAEEVVQETWLAVLEGVHRFEGRSSLKTWIFHILANRARTRAKREGRSVPFSSFLEYDADLSEPAVELDRFFPADHKSAGHWVSFPSSWNEVPEARLLSKETSTRIQQAIEALPVAQRTIIVLRDVEGWTSEEACQFLGISESNQRVLLHRARSKVRGALERYLEDR